MNDFRTATGGRIDRSAAIRFEFDGKPYVGYQGDTLASALLANGIHLLGRSFKYHRPRGLLGAGAEDPNALVTVWRDEARRVPNINANQVELYEGLKASSQNRWPSLRFDAGAINSLISRFIPAGFYYKTFMWPRTAWHKLYEPAIRRSAGLGVAPTLPDPDAYSQCYAHCEVLVVGAGPAGLAAALAAANSGARVILCEQQAELGGSLLHERTATIDGRAAELWLESTLERLHNNPRVTLLTRTQAFGYFPHNLIGLAQRLTDHQQNPANGAPRERLWSVRAREVVLATGAIERPLLFPDNDRPGILLAGAARTLVNRYGVLPGKRAVVVTSHDAAYRAAIDVHNAGTTVQCIADVRKEVSADLQQMARVAGIEVRLAQTVLGTSGSRRVSGVRLATVVDAASSNLSSAVTVRCDALLLCGGFTPSVHLFSQSRGTLAWDESVQAWIPGRSEQRERSAGACAGQMSLAAALSGGQAAGRAAASAAQADSPTRALHLSRATDEAERPHAVSGDTSGQGVLLGPLPQPAGWGGKRAFVDWQNDVTVADLQLALREGFQSVEHIKRYTTTGMATDQGKTSNLNAHAVVAAASGRSIRDVGLTTYRMPYTPVTFGQLAGRARGELFDPVRRTPMHAWAEQYNAVFEDVGLWKRARWFARGKDNMHEAVARECRAVRSSAGIFDASTLGKIEVVGADAAEFLNRMYVNAWNTLAPGRSRYGILLREDGFIMDDGVIARLAPDRFHVTTTTGGAARVYAVMEDYLQTEWPDLRVWLTSTTEQWAVIAVQGPRSREILQCLESDIDLSAAAMPHMSVATGHICGVPTRLFRVSFTGELGFEVNVPADYGNAIWEAIWAAGDAYGLMPYGTESMHVLRAEKGYIIIGQDTDGTVTPDDAGLTWAIGKSKPDFVGRRSLQRDAMKDPNRKQLVGLRTVDPKVVLEEGAQIVETPGQKAPMKLIGHVTSSYDSAVLGHSIAMAMVAGGRARMGQKLYVPMPGGDIAVEVVSPVFYDPKGERLNG